MEWIRYFSLCDFLGLGGLLDILVNKIFILRTYKSVLYRQNTLTAFVLAINSARKYAGFTYAVLGFCPFLLGGIVSPLVGFGDIFFSTLAVIFGCALVSLALFFIARKHLK